MVAVKPPADADRYQVSIEQYAQFRRNGFLVVPGLVSLEEIDELRQHTEDLMQGRLPEQQTVRSQHLHSSGKVVMVNEFGAPPDHLSPEEKAQFFLRIHMLHRKLALHERYMLHPRVLDVLEVLIGPDVLAMQTMLFLKPPGSQGQGWHQDSFYIPTHPDTLCGAWIAIDDCDEQNGAMWFAKGSGVEPIYPPCPELSYGFGDKLVKDIRYVKGVSDTDDSKNMLTRVADEYDQVLCPAKQGDVVFFNGHVLHRSKKNWTADRFRRSFVSHYCNARSFTQWGAEAPVDPETGMANASHILARGDTHLPFAQPKFGTPCAATLNREQRRQESQHAMRMIADTNNGLLGCAIADPAVAHDDDDKKVSASGY
jgi:ectoine hydroxylase-related dioxygenase (phytanoyl-CoA dioxygenase family)